MTIANRIATLGLILFATASTATADGPPIRWSGNLGVTNSAASVAPDGSLFVTFAVLRPVQGARLSCSAHFTDGVKQQLAEFASTFGRDPEGILSTVKIGLPGWRASSAPVSCTLLSGDLPTLR